MKAETIEIKDASMLTLEAKVTRGFYVRTWVALALIRLACWVAKCRLDIKGDK
jgi:hypothetical protein